MVFGPKAVHTNNSYFLENPARNFEVSVHPKLIQNIITIALQLMKILIKQTYYTKADD